MARCPFGPHRLWLQGDMACKRCGEDLKLYVAVRDLPLSYYNEARRLWDESELEEAAGWLRAALKLRPDFAEAHWLFAAIEARSERIESARHHLIAAQALGARTGEGLLTLIGRKEPASGEVIEPDIQVAEEGVEISQTEITEPVEEGIEIPETEITEPAEEVIEIPQTEITEPVEEGIEIPETEITEPVEAGIEIPETEITEPAGVPRSRPFFVSLQRFFGQRSN